MVTNKRKFGDLGEKIAIKFLKNKKYKIVETNFKNKTGRMLGEIDIIAQDIQANELVFVEVKTREYNKFKDTLPEENITSMKLKKLVRVANFYLQNKKLTAAQYRFDAISVWLDLKSKKAKVKHICSL